MPAHHRFIVLAATALAAACASAVTPGVVSPTLRVVSYNVRHGRGMDEMVNLERTAAVLRNLQPDIVALQEVDNRVARSGNVSQADSLGALLGMRAAFGAFMPYQGGQYGLAVLSRFPVVNAREIALPRGNEPRVALLVDIALPEGDTISVINVHFDWVSNDSFRFAQASTLDSTLAQLKRPFVLLGDFNDQPGSRTMGLFDRRAVRLRKDTTGNPLARFTFSSTDPRQEIDHIMVSPAAAWYPAAPRVVDERMASDHRPVVVDLRRRRR